MKRVLTLLVGLALSLVLIVLGVGAVLPAEHVATGSVALGSSPEQIWAVISDYPDQPAWRKDLRSVMRLADQNGHPVWRETYANGESMSYETIEANAPYRLVRRIADADAPFGGSWEFTIRVTDGGTWTTITELGSVPNPIYRFVSRFIIGHTKYLDQYLHALAARMGGVAPFK